MAELAVLIGRKGTAPSDADPVVQRGIRPSQPEEAEGQVAFTMVSCWSCWAVNQLAAPDAASFAFFFCWNCGAYNETSAIG